MHDGCVAEGSQPLGGTRGCILAFNRFRCRYAFALGALQFDFVRNDAWRRRYVGLFIGHQHLRRPRRTSGVHDGVTVSLRFLEQNRDLIILAYVTKFRFTIYLELDDKFVVFPKRPR